MLFKVGHTQLVATFGITHPILIFLFVILQLLENYGVKVMCILHVLLNSFLSFEVMDSNEMYDNLGLIFFM
jgi:hypothetical protein